MTCSVVFFLVYVICSLELELGLCTLCFKFCLLCYALILCHLPYYALKFFPLCSENIIENSHYGTAVNSLGHPVPQYGDIQSVIM